jgi:hypothetical protein
MKSRRSNDNSSAAHDAIIDAALGVYGRAIPKPGLESRVTGRIASTRQFYRSGSTFTNSRWRLFLRGASVGALAAAAACAIVVGTVRHSQHMTIPQAAGVSPSGGVSAASGTRVPTHAIPQSATINPQSPRTAPHSRATVSRNAWSKPAGSAVPRSPYPPDQESTPPQQ